MNNGQTFDGGDIAFQAGCTACVALITKTEIYVANAGDTRCVAAIKGTAKDLSVDHKPNLPSEKRRVERAGGFVEDGRVQGIIAISRALGDWEYKNNQMKPEDNMVSAYPEIIVDTITSNHDFLILACDGIWDCLTSQQAVDFVYKHRAFMEKSPSMSQTVKEVSPPKKMSSTTVTHSVPGKK